MYCQQCGRNCKVHGIGLSDSPIMIIGEAPSEEELSQEKPFVGETRPYFDEGLKLAGISRECDLETGKIYITNAVHCPPIKPDGKPTNPVDDDIELCRVHLHEEISHVHPKLIVTMGAVPAKSLFERDIRITKVHGSYLQFGPIPVFLTFHPSNGLYRSNPQQINYWKLFKEDMSSLGDYLKEQAWWQASDVAVT